MTAAGHYHCSVKSVGRGNGASIIAKAAYRSGERLFDETTQEWKDYTRREHSVREVFMELPEGARPQTREQLWNAAEQAEPRANGRLATELELGLPHELSDAQRRELLSGFVRKIVEKHGVAADVAIHSADDDRNVHAHVLLSHRELGADGFGEIANTRTITRKRNGQQVQEKVAGIAATPADIRAIRQDWERDVNRAYERAGLDIRVDHRSHKDRGIEDEPTKHLGPNAAGMERNGKASDRGDVNRDIEQRNLDRRALKALDAEARQIASAIIELETGRAEEEARQAAIGRYDDLRSAGEANLEAERRSRSETSHEFTAASARSTEPAAPIYDRDADNAAWLERVNAAGIRKGAQETARDGLQASEPAAAPSAPEPAATPTTGPHRTPEPMTEPEQEPGGLRSFGGIAGRVFRGPARLVMNLIAELGDLISPAPPPTKDQAERMERDAGERQQEVADRAHQRKHTTAQDWQMFEQNRQRQYDDLRHGRLGQSVPREIERDDDDRGREREP